VSDNENLQETPKQLADLSIGELLEKHQATNKEILRVASEMYQDLTTSLNKFSDNLKKIYKD
jgi:hypothetical protein